MCAATACSPSIAGTAAPAPVIGVTQRADAGPELEVTPLIFLDPAPAYEGNALAGGPEEGDRLVAVQFRVTNRGRHDELIGPTGTVHFHGSDGKAYDDSLVDTSAGPMFDQVWLGRDQSVVGYLTAEISETVTVEAVDFEVGFQRYGDVLRWEVAGPAVITTPGTVPSPPAREDSRAGTHPLGEAAELAGEQDGVALRLSVAATGVVDPAEPTQGVRPGEDRRLVAVRFDVRNTGDEPYSDVESDADLRKFVLYNEADEAVVSHVYGASEEEGFPLPPDTDDTWTILFEVPDGFEAERVSFTPMFGRTTTTFWAAD